MSNTPLQVVPLRHNNKLDVLVSPQSASHNRLLKLSSAGKTVLAQSPNLPESIEDEVRNTRQRRHSRNFSGVISLSDQGDKAPKWSKDKLLQHYSECMKLSQENKINHKNAFDLQLIEHMGEMIRQDGLLNFRVAGGTIFAGAKIYASRVDAIHSEIYRVLSSLSTGDKDDNLPNEDNNDDPGKKAKKRKKHSKILETTESNLRVQMNHEFAAEEPKSRLQSRAIDAASCTTLNLNYLSLHKDDFVLHYDYDTVKLHKQNSSDETTKYQDLPLTQIRKQSSLQLSQFFHQINFDQTDVEVMSEAYDSADSGNDAVDEQINLDPCPSPDDICDANDADETVPVFDSPLKATLHNKVTDVKSALDVAQLVAIAPPAEYSYFKPDILSVCDGHGHWMKTKRFRTASIPTQQEGIEPCSEKRRTKRRKVLHEKQDLQINGQIARDKKLQPQKVSKAKRETLRKNMKDNLMLEHVDKVAESSIRARELKIILKPLTRKLMQQAGVTLAEPNNIEHFNYDDEEYCPACVADDSDDTGPDLFTDTTECFFPDFSQTIVSSEMSRDHDVGDYNALLEGDHLVDQPRKLEKIQIHFAKRAKRIDVRKLKSAMWNMIQPDEETSVSIPTGNNQTSPNKLLETEKNKSTENIEISSSSETPQLFSDMYSNLPGKVSKSMVENLSVPLTFTCLLHLANEKQLKIEGLSTLSDLKISQGL